MEEKEFIGFDNYLQDLLKGYVERELVEGFHFVDRGEILNNVLCDFEWELGLIAGQNSLLSSSQIDDDVLIASLKKFIDSLWECPDGEALYTDFFNLVMLVTVLADRDFLHFTIFFYLDRVALVLSNEIAKLTAGLAEINNKSHQALKASENMERKGAESRASILEAFKYYNAKWHDDTLGGKKPIEIEDKRYSLYGFASRILMVEHGIELTEKQIVYHLRNLKKDEEI